MNYLHSIREYATPVPVKSTFLETGRITPEEFVLAGDYLVYKCPTWKWCSGDLRKRREYLPPNKQYLVTRNVPCIERVEEGKQMFKEYDEDDWRVFQEPPDSVTHIEPVDIDDEKSNEIDKDVNHRLVDSSNIIKDDDMDLNQEIKNDIHDSGEGKEIEDDENDEDDDFFDASNDDCYVNDTIIRHRSYDVYITWDKYYQTPRVWLFGYDENKTPLGKDEMFQDISSEHAKKTVTYEVHPHENIPSMSIHPCKHDSVMKNLIKSRNDTEPLRVEQYMVMFLKFIGTVIPTISYDYSMSM